MIKKVGMHKLSTISNLYSIFSNCIGVIIKNVLSPFIIVTNSIFSTDVIQITIEQQLYDSRYRASMGSMKSLIKNVLFSILALILGKLADVVGIVSAIISLQLLKFIPIIIYNNIIKNMKMS